MSAATAQMRPTLIPLAPRFTWIDTKTTFEVCATLRDGAPAIIAADAITAAGLPLTEDLAADARCPFAGTADADAHARSTAWSHETLLDVLAVRADDAQPAAFLRWLDRRIQALLDHGLERILAEHEHRGYAGNADGDPVKVPEVYSVRDAAKVLDRDPAIQIGRDRLFEYLQIIGWIERTHAGTWGPRAHVRTDGFLTTQHVNARHYSRDEPYPQLILTVAGVLELHRRLGGIAHLDLTQHPTLNLDEE